jgi:hypothetical protein
LNLSNKSFAKLYDPIRKRWFKALPEEEVRQNFLLYLIEVLDFPKNLISLEIGLQQFSHLQVSQSKLPSRRIDMVAYAKEVHSQHSLYPLVLIECKDHDFSDKALGQLKGYNAFVKAPYICLANKDSVRCGFYHVENEEYEYLDSMPKYGQLLDFAKEHFFRVL